MELAELKQAVLGLPDKSHYDKIKIPRIEVGASWTEKADRAF